MTAKHAFYIAALVAVGFYIGKRATLANASKPEAHNEIATAGDWWSYAGSWSAS